MRKGNLISIKELCSIHNVEPSFINAIREFGLVEITTVNESGFIHVRQLIELERIIRLHRELKINLEGIEAINHLIKKIKVMQDEINTLKNRLSQYETGK